MKNFIFKNSTKILFGKGMEEKIGTEMARFAKKILLHYGGGSIKKNGVYQSVTASLKKTDLEVLELGGVKPNPRLSLVREGVALCKKEGIDAILAVGGGSVIDSAKAIALGAATDGDVWDFFTGKVDPEESLPLGVVLTIPAAGSESSVASVITWEDRKMKYAVENELLRPVCAVLNPEFSYSLSAYQTACGAVDMLAHVMERYFSQELDTDFSDRLCEAAMRAIIANAPRVLEAPKDYAARAELMWAGTIAHNDLLGRGREEDWATHMIEHELSGQYDVAHGAGLAVIFPAWMRYVYTENRERFIQYALRVWGVDYYAADPDWTIREGIRRHIRFLQSIGMPTTLEKLGITDNRYEEMAAQAARFGSLGSFKKLLAKDVVAIYKLAENNDI